MEGDDNNMNSDDDDLLNNDDPVPFHPKTVFPHKLNVEVAFEASSLQALKYKFINDYESGFESTLFRNEGTLIEIRLG